MGYPGPRIIDPNIDERLVESLIVPVHARCTAQGYFPSVERIQEALGVEIGTFCDDYALSDIGDWPDFVTAEYPDFDIKKGGDQGKAGKEDAIRAEYRWSKCVPLLANYYEGNWDGEIETAAALSVVEAMQRAGLKQDPMNSSKEAALEAAESEWGEEYPGDEE